MRRCCVLMSVIWMANGARAADAAAAEADPADIIVTGERVTRSLRQTASSVVVFDARELERRSEDRIDQLLAFVPNVQPGSGGEGPAIRGQDSTGVLRDVAAFLGGSRPRTTLSIDGRALTYYEFIFGSASTWDIASTEVFRGPQTTTNGRNSIAGAIIVHTRQPTFEWEGRARLTSGSFHSRQASAVVSGPIVDQQLAVRASIDARMRETSSDLADAVVGADPNQDRYALARLRFRAEPRAWPGLTLDTSYVHARSRAPQFDPVAPPFEDRRVPQAERTNGVYDINSDSFSAVAQAQLGPGLEWASTLSWGDGSIRRFGLPGLGQAHTESRDFSIESTLNWQTYSALGLRGGVSHLTSHLRQEIDVTGIGLGKSAFQDRQQSGGLFAEASWRPMAALTLTGSLRYQRDSQDREGLLRPPAGIRPFQYHQSFDAWLPRLSASYDLMDKLTVGLLAQRGYNPGGTTLDIYRQQRDDFDAETMWSFEAFVRAVFAGGRGLLTANLFYNDFSNAQRATRVMVQPPVGPPIATVDMVNVDAAEALGAEAQMIWALSGQLSLQLGVGLLDTRILRTRRGDDPLAGKQFQRSPIVSASAGINWEPLEGLELSAQMRGSSGYFSDDFNTAELRIKGWAVVNARAAYTRGSLTGFVYARNLFDRFYMTYLFNNRLGTAGDPRGWGLGLEARF